MEENINGELTFRKIWQQIKKSGVRIIVYAIVALIVCGGILGICDIFVSQSQYETSITYYYSGAELGEGPWGGQFDVVADITSVGNVSTALDKLEYSDEEKDALVKLVIKNLSVVSAVDEKVEETTGALLSGTYSYKIVLAQDSDIDKIIKSRNSYNNIVSAITSNHIENFKNKYSFSTTLGKLAVMGNYNAFQNYSIIKGNINVFLEESKMCDEIASSFVSTSQKMSFSMLKNRIENVLLPKLEVYSDFVASNGIDAKNEKDYVNKMLADATSEVTRREKDVEECLEALSALTNGTVGSPNTGTIIVNPADPETLNKAIEDLNLAKAKRDLAEAEKPFGARFQKDYESAQSFADRSEAEKTTLINSANALVNEVVSEYNSLVDSYKLMIEDYNNGYNVTSLVRMTSVPTQATNSPITLKVGVIIELMVLIVSVIVAMLVTSKKGAMKIKRKMEEEQDQDVVYENVEPQGLPSQGLSGPVDEVEDTDPNQTDL
ncbi:MAG: hypothetical protein K2I46_04635 [Clostridia bacterium]|nr:hypothetical protein [Clostridia bacterium]